MLATDLIYIASGLVGIFFSRTIHRRNLFGVPQHIPTAPHSVLILRVMGAVFLLVGILGLWFRLKKEGN